MAKRIVGAWLVLVAAVVSASVLATARADLIVTSFEIRPAVPFPGTVATLLAVVENVGDRHSGASVSVRFVVDDEEIGCSTIPAGMDAHTRHEVSTSWTAEEGPHVLAVEVDQPLNRVPESLETNNTASMMVFVPSLSSSARTSAGVRVAVAEFDDRSRARFVNVGAGVANKLAGRLAEAGVVVVERGELEAILQQQSLDPFSLDNLVLAARQLGVDLVVAGTVDAVNVQEIALSLGIIRFSSAAVDVRASAQLVDVRTGAPVLSMSVEGKKEGASGVSADFTGFLSLGQAYDVCGEGLQSDRSAYSIGETVAIGHTARAEAGWFSVEVFTAADEFLCWLGWRFIGAGECGKWFWNQRDALGAQVGSGLYRAKLWNGTAYVAVATFQIRPGWSASAPPIGEITVGSEAFDRTIAGMAVQQIVDQLAASVLSAMARGVSHSESAATSASTALAFAAAAAPTRVAQVAATLPDGRVAINIGSSSGVAVGDRFEILAVENLTLDPLTLDIVGFDVTERKGEIEIVEAHDRVSYGVCVSAFQPGIGDVARWVGP